MCLACSAKYMSVGLGLLVATTTGGASSALFSEKLAAMQTLPKTTQSVDAPELVVPGWLKQKRAEAAAKGQPSQTSSVRTVTYDVMTKGKITASVAEFRSLANATLNDGRGWSRLGVSFKEVASGGMFTLVLSSSDQMTSFSPGCGTEYSCRAGRYVIINQDRWLGATPSWNNAGGSLRDYRHMVVNHETGHWLGHDHQQCGGAGQPAPVMQQQSINLAGCTFNPWPTKGELWSTQLGIR